MEISVTAIYKLINQGIINNLSADIFNQISKVISLRTDENVHLKDIANENNCSVATVKEAYMNILSLITEAAKYDYDIDKLHAELSNTGIHESHVEILCTTYKSHKTYLCKNLQIIGVGLPHIVDIKWKMEFISKTSIIPRKGPHYSIFLTTMKNNQLKSIKFTCNIIQLQDLILKLKDAVRHLEKLTVC